MVRVVTVYMLRNLSFFFSLSPALSCSLSLTYTLSLSLPLSHSLPLSLLISLSISLSISFPLSLSLYLPLDHYPPTNLTAANLPYQLAPPFHQRYNIPDEGNQLSQNVEKKHICSLIIPRKLKQPAPTTTIKISTFILFSSVAGNAREGQCPRQEVLRADQTPTAMPPIPHPGTPHLGRNTSPQ